MMARTAGTPHTANKATVLLTGEQQSEIEDQGREQEPVPELEL